jgi:ABC-type hemin transport system ATPase subunit
MKVDKLHMRQFSVFEEVTLDFCPGINVLLGSNATGKSHTMKALYAPLKTFEQAGTTIPLAERMREKLANVFKPDEGSMGRLVHRRRGQGQGWIDISGASGEIGITLFTRGKRALEMRAETWRSEAPAIFLPTREVLAMYEGFVTAYQDRELAFDETYYDACVALGRAALRGPRSQAASTLIQPIGAALGGNVVLRGSRFYLERRDGFMEAHLVAEGLRKIASLAHLVLNGSLTTNGILFWDEPEANLNPQLVSVAVEVLLALGARGVQIFLTTHDYLLSHKLSLLSEYGKRPDVPIRFFAFHRADGDGPVRVDAGATLAALPDNPILDEFSKHYAFERALFDEDHGGAAQ